MEVASRILVVDGLSITKFRIVAPFGAESNSDSSSSPYRLMDVHPGLVTILVMQRPTASVAQKLIALGVRALLHKDDDLGNTLNHTIQTAVKGNMTISPLIAEFLDKTVALPTKITQRDLNILQLLTEGMEAKEIAAHLGVTYGVVNRTINRLLRTYNVQNVPQLTAMAYQILKVRQQLE